MDPDVFAILGFCSNPRCSEEDRDKPGTTGEYTEENDRRFHLHMFKLHPEAQEHNSKIVFTGAESFIIYQIDEKTILPLML